MFYEKIKQQLFFILMQKNTIFDVWKIYFYAFEIPSQSDKTLIGINLVQICFVNWKFM